MNLAYLPSSLVVSNMAKPPGTAVPTRSLLPTEFDAYAFHALLSTRIFPEQWVMLFYMFLTLYK